MPVNRSNYKLKIGALSAVKRHICVRFAQSIHTFTANQKGATALEFAFVAAPFIALLLAVIHTAIVFLAQQGLETAGEKAVRLLLTGKAQTYAGTNASGSYTGMTAADFKAAACKSLPPFLFCDRLYVDVQTSSSLTSPPPVPAFTYGTDGKVNTAFNYKPGNQNTIVTMRLLYLWPVTAGPMGMNMANQANSNRLLVATNVFITEGY